MSLACTSLSITSIGQPRHILRLAGASSHGSLREGRKRKHASFFFFLPKLPGSSHLAHWPKQVTHHAQCQSGQRLQSLRAQGVDNREGCSWGYHRSTPTPATLSINQSLVRAASVFTQFCCTSPIILNIVANLSIFSKRSLCLCAFILKYFLTTCQRLIPLQTSQCLALVLT